MFTYQQHNALWFTKSGILESVVCNKLHTDFDYDQAGNFISY